MSDTSGVGVGANDARVVAGDPSTWTDETHAANEALYEPGGPFGPDGDDDESIEVAAATDAEGLRRERAEVEEALAGARRKVEKQRVFYEAAETEVGRLQHRIEAIDAELSSYADPAPVEHESEV